MLRTLRQPNATPVWRNLPMHRTNAMKPTVCTLRSSCFLQRMKQPCIKPIARRALASYARSATRARDWLHGPL